MKKRILSILLVCCMMLTLLPTTAFAALSDSLGNIPEENQAILEQLSALTGGSSDQVLSMLDALGLLDEDGNFKVDQTITLDGRVLTLAAVMELLEDPATDLTRIADVDGTPVALGDLKTMIQIEQELQRIKDCLLYTSYPRCHAIGIRGAAGLEEARFDHVSVGVLDDPLHALRLDLEASMQRWTAAAHSAALCVYSCNCSTLIVFSPPLPLRNFSISELLILTITLSLTCNSSKEILVTFCVAKSQ